MKGFFYLPLTSYGQSSLMPKDASVNSNGKHNSAMTAQEHFEVQTQYCNIMLLVFHGLAVNRYKYGEKQYAGGRGGKMCFGKLLCSKFMSKIVYGK